MTDDKNVFELLNLREQELIHQISALRAQIEEKENELVYVRKAKEATSISVSVNQQIPPFSPEPPDVAQFTIKRLARDESLDFFKKLSIKQLVMQAMLANFRQTGATSQTLREFIGNAYGREIEQASLRPQLHRLKDQRILLQKSDDDKWHLSPEALRLWSPRYNHPSSLAAAIRELIKDEPTDGRAAVMKPHQDDFLE